MRADELAIDEGSRRQVHLSMLSGELQEQLEHKTYELEVWEKEIGKMAEMQSNVTSSVLKIKEKLSRFLRRVNTKHFSLLVLHNDLI